MSNKPEFFTFSEAESLRDSLHIGRLRSALSELVEAVEQLDGVASMPLAEARRLSVCVLIAKNALETTES